jgi:hypothetical protein
MTSKGKTTRFVHTSHLNKRRSIKIQDEEGSESISKGEEGLPNQDYMGKLQHLKSRVVKIILQE